MGFGDGSSVKERNIVVEDEEGFNNVVGYTEAEEKRLVRKIDLFIWPTIWLMYLLSYVDRTKYDFSILLHVPTMPSISTFRINLSSALATPK